MIKRKKQILCIGILFMLVFSSFGVVAKIDFQKILMLFAVTQLFKSRHRPRVEQQGCEAEVNADELYKAKMCGSEPAKKEFETCKQGALQKCRSDESAKCHSIQCCTTSTPPVCTPGFGTSPGEDCTAGTPKYNDIKTCARAKEIYMDYADALEKCADEANIKYRIKALKGGNFAELKADCNELDSCIENSEVKLTQKSVKLITDKCKGLVSIENLNNALKRPGGIENVFPKDMSGDPAKALDAEIAPRATPEQTAKGGQDYSRDASMNVNRDVAGDPNAMEALDGKPVNPSTQSRGMPKLQPTASKGGRVSFQKVLGTATQIGGLVQMFGEKQGEQRPQEQPITPEKKIPIKPECPPRKCHIAQCGELDRNGCCTCKEARTETALADAKEQIPNIKSGSTAKIEISTAAVTNTNPELKGILVDASQLNTKGFRFVHWNDASVSTKNFYDPETDLIQFYNAGPAVIHTIEPDKGINMYVVEGEGNDDLENKDGLVYKLDKDGKTEILSTYEEGALIEDADNNYVWLDTGDTIYSDEKYQTNTNFMHIDSGIIIKPGEQATTSMIGGGAVGLAGDNNINIKLGGIAPPEKRSIGIVDTEDSATVFTNYVNTKLEFYGEKPTATEGLEESVFPVEIRNDEPYAYGSSDIVGFVYTRLYKDYEINANEETYYITSDANSAKVIDKNGKVIQDSSDWDIGSENLNPYQEMMLGVLEE